MWRKRKRRRRRRRKRTTTVRQMRLAVSFLFVPIRTTPTFAVYSPKDIFVV
jgi:hypothetical protein